MRWIRTPNKHLSRRRPTEPLSADGLCLDIIRWWLIPWALETRQGRRLTCPLAAQRQCSGHGWPRCNTDGSFCQDIVPVPAGVNASAPGEPGTDYGSLVIIVVVRGFRFGDRAWTNFSRVHPQLSESWPDQAPAKHLKRVVETGRLKSAHPRRIVVFRN